MVPSSSEKGDEKLQLEVGAWWGNILKDINIFTRKVYLSVFKNKQQKQ